MKTITCLIAMLIGYYWEPCPSCGRGIAIMGDGSIRSIWCSKRQHARDFEESRR